MTGADYKNFQKHITAWEKQYFDRKLVSRAEGVL